MNTLSALAIITLAALIHASFQLSVSILTLMSGHAIGRKTKHLRLLGLIGAFITGVAIITPLLLSFITLALDTAIVGDVPAYVWAAACGIVIGVGVAVWVFYYKRQKGTALWIPRPIARYLTSRARTTRSSAESFGLGMTSVIGELLFCMAPLTVAGLTLLSLEAPYQLLGILLYALISILPLIVIMVLLGSGHSISRIQRWRESNKAFLQFAAGSALIVLGFYLYVDAVVPAVISTGVGA